MVQGHVDTTGTLLEIITMDQGIEIWVGYPTENKNWLIPTGSITIDGISLTIADLKEDRLKVAIIPHTLSTTTIGSRDVGDAVNLEFDMIAKMVSKSLRV